MLHADRLESLQPAEQCRIAPILVVATPRPAAQRELYRGRVASFSLNQLLQPRPGLAGRLDLLGARYARVPGVAQPRGAAQSGLRAAADPDRRVRLLHRLRLADHVAKMIIATSE